MTKEEAVQNEQLPVDDQSTETAVNEEQSAEVILTPEAVKDFLRNNPDALSDDDVYSIPTVRSRMDRAISKQHEELRRRQLQEEASVRERRALVTRARQFVSQIDAADANQLRVWGAQNPNIWAEYADAQRVLLDPENQISREVSANIQRSLIDEMRTECPDANFDLATSATDVLRIATDAKVKIAMAQMKKTIEAEMESLRKELAGRETPENEQPETTPHSGNRYVPESFEDIEDKYARGEVDYATYRQALNKRR